MQGQTKQLHLCIEYFQHGEVIKREVRRLRTHEDSSELSLEQIYRCVNEFMDAHPELDPKVTISDTSGTCRFQDRPVDVERCYYGGGYMIHIILRPISRRKYFVDSINEIDSKLDNFIQSEQTLFRQNLEENRQGPPPFHPNIGDATIGILYSDPLVYTDYEGNLKHQTQLSVTYEQEIPKIIKTTNSKRINVRSMSASRRNLLYMLRTPSVVFIHIISHGGNQYGKCCLKFEKESAQHIGLTDKTTVQEFRAIFEAAHARLGCLVIMACYSMDFATAVTDFVDFVVAINKDSTIDNTIAEVFSERFYESLISGNTYEDSFATAQEYVHKTFYPCSCDKRRHGLNRDFPCRGKHVEIKCNCPQLNENRHLKECSAEGASPSFVVFMQDEQDKNYYWYCCCGCPHSESHKFERSSKQNNCKPAKIPDLISLSEEAKQGSGELFVMPSTYLTPVQHMSNFVTLLRKCEDRHSQYPTDILLIHGSKGVGKSCFIKRVSGYFFERTRQDFELVYQQWIYVDLSFYQSMLHFQSRCNIQRQHIVYESLKAVVEYANSHRCFFVLDNCSSLAVDNREAFLETVQNQISKQLRPGSKLIMIFETHPLLSDIFKRYHSYEFKLNGEERLKMHPTLSKLLKYYTAKFKKQYSSEIRQLWSEIYGMLPHNINECQTFLGGSNCLHDNPIALLEVIKQIQAERQAAQEILQREMGEVAIWMKSLSASHRKALLVLCLVSKHQPKQVLNGVLLSGLQTSLEDLERCIETNSNGLKKIKKDKWKIIIEAANQLELKDAFTYLLGIWEYVVAFIMDRTNQQEEPFMIFPLLDIPDVASLSPSSQLSIGLEKLFGTHSKLLAHLMEQCTRLGTQISEIIRLEKPPTNLRRFLEGNNKKSYCNIVSLAPLLKHFLGRSHEAHLSKDVYIALDSLRHIKHLSPNDYLMSCLNLMVLLMFSRSEEKGPIRRQFATLNGELGLNETNIGFSLPKEYINGFLDLQLEYLCDVKLRTDANSSAYRSALSMLSRSSKHVFTMSPRDKRHLRHCISYSQAFVHFMSKKEEDRPQQRDAESLITELSVYLQDNFICKLKYYECSYLLLTYYEKSKRHEDYRRLLVDLEANFTDILIQPRVAELRERIEQQVLHLQKCLIKVLSSNVSRFSKSGIRMIQPWLCSSIHQLCRTDTQDHVQGHIESDVLNCANLEDALKTECRVLFLRFDCKFHQRKSKKSVFFESEDGLGYRNMPVEQFAVLDFSRVEILVLCGNGCSEVTPLIQHRNFISIDVIKQDEKVFDEYKRVRIIETYCDTFLVTFVRALLSTKGSGFKDERTETALIEAEHMSACVIGGLLGKRPIEDFVKVRSKLTRSQSPAFVLDTVPGKISSKHPSVDNCKPFLMAGYNQQFAQTMQTIQQAPSGILVLLVGLSAKDLLRELFYTLLRAGIRNCSYHEQFVDLSKQRWGYCIMDVPPQQIGNNQMQQLLTAVASGHKIVLRWTKKQAWEHHLTKVIIMNDHQSYSQYFALKMCRLFYEEIKPFPHRRGFDAEMFGSYVQQALTAPNPELAFYKRVNDLIKNPVDFAKCLAQESTKQLHHRPNSEKPQHNHGLINQSSERTVLRRQCSAADFKKSFEYRVEKRQNHNNGPKHRLQKHIVSIEESSELNLDKDKP